MNLVTLFTIGLMSCSALVQAQTTIDRELIPVPNQVEQKVPAWDAEEIRENAKQEQTEAEKKLKEDEIKTYEEEKKDEDLKAERQSR